MKTLLLILTTIVILLLPGSSMKAQAPMEDVIYLKNGDTVRGTVVELIPDKTVTIRSAGDSTRIYAMTDVEKIAKQSVALPVTGEKTAAKSEELPSQTLPVWTAGSLILYAGLALPVADFGGTSGQNAGYAKAGFAAGLDAGMPLSPGFRWLSSLNVSINSVDANAMFGGGGVSVDAGSWYSVWLLTGIKISRAITPDAEFYGFGQIGALFGTSPEIDLQVGSIHASQSSSSSTAFAFDVGGGIAVRHLTLGVRYMKSEPEYEVTATGPAGNVRGQFTQPTACVHFFLGFVF